MRIKSFIEISAVFALAAVAATLTTCATPASANEPIKSDAMAHYTTQGDALYQAAINAEMEKSA